MTPRAEQYLALVRSLPDEFDMRDATHLTPQERVWLTAQGVSFTTTRTYGQVIGHWPARKRAEDLRNAVLAKRAARGNSNA